VLKLPVLTSASMRLPVAEEIRVHEVRVEHHALQAGVADAAAEAPGQAFLDLEVDVDQVVAAGDRDRLLASRPR
jgi:hypothetical protein